MKNKVQNLTFMALMAGILCIVGPVVIPIGMVPMSFANMAIYLTILLLDKKRVSISVAIYLLIGFVGMPVFAGFTGGVGKLFGPTGGYLIGYLVLSWVGGSILERIKRPIPALVIGTTGMYVVGTLWLMGQSKLDFFTAFTVGCLPFIAFDFLKILGAVFLGKAIKKRIAFML